jgi:hypothetical protein
VNAFSGLSHAAIVRKVEPFPKSHPDTDRP